jgi:uncharacterized membrane protein
MVNSGSETSMAEERLAALEARVEELERVHARAHALPVHARAHALPVQTAPPRARRPRRKPVELEELIGGRVLAWLGAIAVLAGLAFLLTVAISRSWLGQDARTALAAIASLGLLAAGVWLHERRGRTEASLAAAGAGLAGCFATLVVAGELYRLVSPPVALALALATGAVGTALALRWRAQAIAWLGLLGALASPAALGALATPGTLAFLLIAYAAAVAVLLCQRWTSLAFAFLIATPQWLWLLADRQEPALTVAGLTLAGALTVAAAVGFELRSRSPASARPRSRCSS